MSKKSNKKKRQRIDSFTRLLLVMQKLYVNR